MITQMMTIDPYIAVHVNAIKINTHFFIGDIDEVRLWDRALSAQEVKKVYEGGIFFTEGQVLHLPFSNVSSMLNQNQTLPEVENLTKNDSL